jgi:hypothetical protein
LKTIEGHRKKLRKGGVALLLLGAALLIAGCNWATAVRFPRNPDTYIVVHHDYTDHIVWNCTGKYGSGNDRGLCAQKTIYALCKGAPVSGLSRANCELAANDPADQGVNLEGAIRDLLHQGAGCLRLTLHTLTYPGGSTVIPIWDAVVLGYPSCNTTPSE